MIELDGPHFIDRKTKRTVVFHGINVGGGAKLPVGIPSHSRQGFWVDYDRNVTFVGRPFSLQEADLHLQRLVTYGFNLIRFIITWEAIEHEGPGIYDTDYLDYVIEMLKKCQHYGIQVFIDPHQDTWSRHCGGSGHPGWTLALAGLNPLNFNTTVAALVQNTYNKPETYPRMIWNTNYQRLAAATMFTLFFAGKTFAPRCMIDQVNIQDYLQTHFFNAIGQLAIRIQQHGLEDDVVLGYDTINEPGHGYLGFPDLDKLDDSDTSFKMGLMPTPFQGMLLGSGVACKVAHYEFIWSGPKKTGDILVDPNDDGDGGGDSNDDGRKTITAWLTQEELDDACMTFGWKRAKSWEQAGCIWELHGVWDKTTGSLDLPHYFATHPTSEKPTHFAQDCWLPFLTNYIQAIRSIHKNAIIFVQPPIIDKPPKLPENDPTYQRLVYTPHWYDGLTLVKKKWCSYNIDFINLNRGKYGSGPLRFLRALCLGEKAIRKCFIKQLATIRAEGLEQIGNYPCLLGEIGIPYDMQNGSSSSSSSLSSSMSQQTQSIWKRLWCWIMSLFFSKNKAMAMAHSLLYDINKPDSSQNKAMDASINAAEGTLLNYTLWQYVPDNDPKWGDLWNGEDLSIWQQEHGLDGNDNNQMMKTTVGATIKKDDGDFDKVNTESTVSTIAGESSPPSPSPDEFDKNAVLLPDTINKRRLVCLHRPHPRLTAGTPISITFNSPTTKRNAYYRYEFQPNTNIDTTITEIFVPKNGFPLPSSSSELFDATPSTEVSVSLGQWKIHQNHQDFWLLHWWWSEQETMDTATTLVLELNGSRFVEQNSIA